MATRQELEQALSNPNTRRMLNLIASTEGVKHGYNTLFGNDRVNDLAVHPNIRKPFRQTDGKTNYTTAAGRYQFLKNTWDNLAKQYGLNDFTPRNQDLGAVALIAQNGALSDVLNGNYQSAIKKLGGTWASLPSSTYAQPKKSWAETNKLLGGSGMPKGSMNDLHQLMRGVKLQPAVGTGRQLRQGFASDIPPELRDNSPLEGVKQASTKSSTGKTATMDDLHKLIQDQRRSNFKPFDWKASEKEAIAKQAKESGPTNFWESALLGASDLGAGVLQGTSYAADKLSSGINSVLGTNLDTGSYDRVTNKRNAVEEWHNLRREANNQGFDIARLGGQVAATAPMAALGRGYQGAKVLSSAGARVAGQNALVGAGIGGAGFAEDADTRLANTAFGAIGGAAGAAAGQKVGQGIGKAIQAGRNASSRFSNTQTNQLLAQINQKLDATLRQNGLSLGELSDDVANGLRQDALKALQSGKDLNATAVARKAVLDRLGLKGTKAQVTGDAKQWQQQAELAKISGAGDPLRDKFINDNAQLSRLLNESIESTGGKATDQYGAMKNALDSVNSQLDQNKQFIGAAYDVAKKAEGNNIVLDGRGFANDAFTALDQQYAASSLPSSIQTILRDVTKNPNQFTLGKSEELIKILNREYKSSLQMGQPTSATYSIGLVRDALESRQKEAMQGLLSSGNDAAQAYQFARQANRFNMEQIEGIPLLQDARKGVEPDKLFNKHILNGNVRELDNTIQLLNNVNPQAVNDIKQQVVQFISNKAINQNGQFSPAGMKRALDSIGDRRLSTMFNQDELRKIKDIGRAGEYLITQPPHSYVNNSNTSAALMNYFGGFINKPGVRVLLAPVKDVVDSRAVNKAMSPDLSGSPVQPTPPSLQQQTILDRLARAGLIGGSSIATQ